jgi:carbamoyl-phosphate synthase small subunit
MTDVLNAASYPTVKSPSLIALEDGLVFPGEHFGASGTFTGELVFNTSMMGYQEILTDPSYAGQIITMTYPEIGNYGANDEDVESKKIYARGLVVRHLSTKYSSCHAKTSLEQFLVDMGIIGISGVDTRAITCHIRDKGAMRCAISNQILDEKELVKIASLSASMEGADFTAEVTTQKPYKMGAGKYKIAVMDFGVKQSILNNLAMQDMELTVFPAWTKAKEILSMKPDGLFLSNGPGDPAASKEIIAQLPELVNTGLPTFGICLGHQLLALSFGAKTYKLKFGHRGGNQPVKDLTTGKVEITCQNHGFAVDQKTMPECLELTHVNLNDKSVEGFCHKNLPVFCVQYHPEASPGPTDANYLFKRFYDLIAVNKEK